MQSAKRTIIGKSHAVNIMKAFILYAERGVAAREVVEADRAARQCRQPKRQLK